VRTAIAFHTQVPPFDVFQIEPEQVVISFEGREFVWHPNLEPGPDGIVFTSGVSFAGDEADVNVGFTTVGLETSSTNTGCNVWNGSYHLVQQGGDWLIDDTHLSRQTC
jgi:hypothetical protein